jgi:hypothetical protein
LIRQSIGRKVQHKSSVFKINDIDTVSVLLLYRFIFTVDCRIKFGNDVFDGFRQPFKRGAAHALDTARWANAAGLAAVAMAVGGLRKAD